MGCLPILSSHKLWCNLNRRFIVSARYFITRALLAAENFEQAVEIIRDVGVGAANACSINLAFLKPNIEDIKVYNIEMGPSLDPESMIDCLELDERKGYMLHCNL